MTGRRRRELADSFRLLASDERWFFRDLLVGAVALVVWVAGTAALATQLADALGVALGLGPGETPSRAAMALFAVLWLAVPAVAVVVRLRGRTLNLRNNVEQYYRFDHPAALLAPPALAVAVVVGLCVALGAFPWYVALVMIPVGLFCLVRTLAFSYRVYSFSRPLVVQALVALSTVVLLGSAFAAVGIASGRGTLVDQVLRAAGSPSWITGTVALEGVAVSGVAAAATAPVVLAAGYVLIQSVVALAVRLIEPDVDRSRMRTGQRYPPFLSTVAPTRPSATAGQADDRPTDAAGDGVDAGSSDGADGDADGAASDEPDEPDLDDVSNTRVFTPPAEDDGDVDPGRGTDMASEASDDDAAGSAGETRAVPGDAARPGESSGRREHCAACGESFSVDTTVRFCPNCGAQLEKQ